MNTALRSVRARCAARLRVPADKSISHRAAIIGAMASEPVRIRNYLDAADTNSTLAAVARARRDRRGPRRRAPDPRLRPAQRAAAGRADRRRQRRHADAPASRVARVPAGRQLHARRRRLDPPAAGRPDRRAAAADGRQDRSARGPLPAVHVHGAPLHGDRLRAPGGQRPGQVVRAAGRARDRRDDGDRARSDPRPHRADAARAPGRRYGARPDPTAAAHDGRQRRRASSSRRSTCPATSPRRRS